MAYNIELHSEHKFSTSPTGTPLYNNWSFNPEPVLKVPYVIGGAIPAAINIDTIIKDYLADVNLENVVVRVKNIIANTEGDIVWSVISGEIFDDTPDYPINIYDRNGYDISASPLDVTTTLRFQKLRGLTEGVYTGAILFSVYDVSNNQIKPNGIDVVLFNYELIVSQTIGISVAPSKLTYSLFRSGSLPASQTFNVTAQGGWVLKVDNRITASLPNSIVNPSDTQVILSASNNGLVTIGLSEALKTYQGDIFETQAIITDSLGGSTYVQIVVNIFDDDILKVTPNELYFKAVKGFTEADAQTLKIKGFGAFNIQGPTWLNLSANSGNNALDLVVTPLSANNLESNIYEGEIIISTNTQTQIVAVKYEVEGIISTSLSAAGFNFTKDLDYLNIRNYFRNDDNFTKITLSAKIYNYISGKEYDHEYPYTLPFFNDAAQFHVGEIINRLLKKALGLNDFNYESLDNSASAFSQLYKPASINLKIEVINRTSSAVLETKNLNNLKFVAGRKPSSFIDNAGILSYTKFHKRVTVNSKELFNFIVPTGIYELFVKKNSETPVLLASQNTAENNIFRFSFSFAQYNIGDEIDLQLKVGDTIYSKKYYVIPEGINSWHIGYINQSKVLELFECTGALTLSSDIKKTTHQYYKDLVERIETLETLNEMKLQINTGDIFKEDRLFITELIRSEKSWLIFNENEAIELDAVGQKLIDYDSDQELYNYEVEFNINRKYDAENFTF